MAQEDPPASPIDPISDEAEQLIALWGEQALAIVDSRLERAWGALDLIDASYLWSVWLAVKQRLDQAAP